MITPYPPEPRSGGEYWHDYIPGIASCMIMLGLGIVSTILGAAWGLVYPGMLMGW